MLAVFLTVALSPLALYAQEREYRYASAAGSRSLSYTVKEGDTLYDIAREHRVELSELMKVNSLTGSLIWPGDILSLPEEKLSSL
ncbi:MAG: LysM peptidoglycan-binding domain-containing protein, partial [Desulfotomaculaceae bacterium]